VGEAQRPPRPRPGRVLQRSERPGARGGEENGCSGDVCTNIWW
jgi:hypothetical protein